jgi:hypothetical protein
MGRDGRFSAAVLYGDRDKVPRASLSFFGAPGATLLEKVHIALL